MQDTSSQSSRNAYVVEVSRQIQHRRLTKDMKRELVKSLRTVTLLAMFSPDSTTVSNIQSCLKSMSVMEPDLILPPILERAGPALEAVVEVRQRRQVAFTRH